MTDINLEGLSIEQLQALHGSIDGAIEQRKNAELIELKEKIDDLIDNSPFTLEEVLEAKPLKKPVAPKYKNPSNEGQTWTGRGRKPVWVVEHLEQGGTLEELAI